MRSKLVVPVTSAFFLFAVLAHLGFFDWQRLARGFRNLGILGSEMIPPDMGILPTAGAALWETVEMSFAGTLLGFLAALPLSIFGTRRLFSSWVAHIARFVAAGIRTIPVLLWAIVFVILFGLGPLAGTFGIAAYTVGYLAKIYADLFEGTDPEILEAVGSTGASRLQLVRFVFLPEGANAILTQLLFMLEYNIRASSILGFVGAGGLGFVMQVYLQTLEYRRLASVLLLILVVVLAMDGLSAWIRKRYLLSAQAS
ncbi:MAG: phosphonate ABC transporter, permease protein PhnE [Deltaproteobacteria bacterium]|nr:phosphonate ABC transporter, permease protein PhnE [Deltaproteobacteria bacterium]MBI2530595.1 phosphonate ABC transporter, permease protein PhnE [Deltaproteobacteria bacterium]